MTKQQALALVGALEARQIPATVSFTFPSAGVETWAVQLDPARTYSGDELAALTDYCTAHGLILSMIVETMGVI